MKKKVNLGFENKGITLILEHILPLKKIKETYKKTLHYQRIVSSITEVGIIEPPIVYPQNRSNGTYLLLDGHTRLEVLKDLGICEVYCLISTDDESYTYNKQVNRLSMIQEHLMILKALKNGVPEERIARTLDVDVNIIRAKRNLLDGVCSEAVDLLKNRNIGREALKIIKKVHPIRQVEMAELMIMANNFTKPYAQALLASTSKEQILEPEKNKDIKGLRPEDIAKMEKEMEKISHDLKMLETSHGQNVMNLVLARGYLSKLLNNVRVVRYLSTNWPDLIAEYQRLVEITSLDG